MPTDCSLYKEALRVAEWADIPARFRSIDTPRVSLPDAIFGINLGPFLFANNSRIATVVGRAQTGKTSVLSMLMMRSILINRIHESANGIGRRKRFVFVNDCRLFRSLRSMGEEGRDAKSFLYDIQNLAIDDFDKVESNTRGLIREIIVHRSDHGRNTLLSVTDPATLREFDPQVYRRIEDGRQIKLGSIVSANLSAGLVMPPAARSMVGSAT